MHVLYIEKTMNLKEIKRSLNTVKCEVGFSHNVARYWLIF